MAAKKKTITTKTLADLGITAQSSWSEVKDSQVRPPRGAGIKIVDEGEGGKKLVEFLQERKLV